MEERSLENGDYLMRSQCSDPSTLFGYINLLRRPFTSKRISKKKDVLCFMPLPAQGSWVYEKHLVGRSISP